MKKKDKIITVLCLLWIGLVLYLKFNGEYTVEKVTDISQLVEQYYQNRALEYIIYEYRNEVFGDDMEDWVDGQGEKSYLLILEDRTMYFWHTAKSIWARNPNETHEDITYSVYYLGQLSSLDSWFFLWNRDRVEPVRGYDNGDGPGSLVDEGSPDGINNNNNNNVVDGSIVDDYSTTSSYEIRQNEYDCIIHDIDTSYFWLEIERSRIFSENNRRSNDINAILILNWLRTTWHYQQYIDLMYQEMYPWLVE